MSTHPKQIQLEQKLRDMADDLDHYLEERFEGLYPLHPNRLPRGKAASVAYDGLFSTKPHRRLRQRTWPGLCAERRDPHPVSRR